jgi:putative transposase
MPRRSRITLAEVPQHLIQRGNNREATFHEHDDYVAYLGWLSQAAKKYDCRIFAYVLMTNHVHLLAATGEGYGLSLMMQYVGRHFVRYFNKKYRRSGTLWEGRFRATLVDTEAYFLRCSRYIECNPVRAGMVEQPGQYRWSSYRHRAYGEPDALLSTHEQYQRLGFGTDERQEAAYRALFDIVIARDELEEIRDATNRGWPLGGDAFKMRVEQALQRPAKPPKRGRPLLKRGIAPSVGEGKAMYPAEKLH